MQGKVLQYDDTTFNGFISGHDGQRYTFTKQDWRGDKKIVAGAIVDFEVDGKAAKDVIGIGADVSPKSRTIALLLCVLIGGIFGAHRFYVGRWKFATVMAMGSAGYFIVLATNSSMNIFSALFIGLFIWTCVDMLTIVLGKFRDSNDKQLVKW